MKKILIFISIATFFIGCHNEEKDENRIADRTILIYMAAENDLTNFAIDDLMPGTQKPGDLKEIRNASYNLGNNNLIVYVDRASNTLPYLLKIVDGVSVDSITWSQTDESTADPALLCDLMNEVANRYTASEYGLVLWGHATGWCITDSKDSIVYTPTPAGARHKAYGRDTGDNSASSSKGKWMNIPSMANALASAPHLKFIFADCCNFQCAENAYELRNVCDYLIASPAEIPGVGAPYESIVPAMFSRKSNFYELIAEAYFNQVEGGYREPITVCKSSEMEDLAFATRQALLSFVPDIKSDYPDMDGIIHYFNEGSEWFYQKDYDVFYDIKDFIKKYADKNTYNNWLLTFQKAIVYKTMTDSWMTNRAWSSHYSDFIITDENYGGMSIFVPQSPYSGNYSKHNERIKQMAWYYAAGYADVGW